MGLHVRVVRAEQQLQPINGELLDLVDFLTATVIAPSRISLGVLVGERSAHGIDHGPAGEVLAGDQLEAVLLAVQFPVDQPGDLRVNGAQRGIVVERHAVSFRVRSCSTRRPCRPPVERSVEPGTQNLHAFSPQMSRAGSTRTLASLWARDRRATSGSRPPRHAPVRVAVGRGTPCRARSRRAARRAALRRAPPAGPARGRSRDSRWTRCELVPRSSGSIPQPSRAPASTFLELEAGVIGGDGDGFSHGEYKIQVSVEIWRTLGCIRRRAESGEESRQRSKDLARFPRSVSAMTAAHRLRRLHPNPRHRPHRVDPRLRPGGRPRDRSESLRRRDRQRG